MPRCCTPSFSPLPGSVCVQCDGGFGDGSTCIPGCAPNGQQCLTSPCACGWDCSYPPEHTADALQAQVDEGELAGADGVLRHNVCAHLVRIIHTACDMQRSPLTLFTSPSPHLASCLASCHITPYAIPPQRSTTQEVVIDTRSITSNLPDVVLGFFFLDDAEEAAEARRALIAAYELDEEAVPLMWLNWEGSPSVFSLA